MEENKKKKKEEEEEEEERDTQQGGGQMRNGQKSTRQVLVPVPITSISSENCEVPVNWLNLAHKSILFELHSCFFVF